MMPRAHTNLSTKRHFGRLRCFARLTGAPSTDTQTTERARSVIIGHIILHCMRCGLIIYSDAGGRAHVVLATTLSYGRFTGSWWVGLGLEGELVKLCPMTADVLIGWTHSETNRDKKLSYRRGTARCVVSVEILPIATQQCRNYLFVRQVLNKSKLWSYRVKVGQCVINMCIQPWRVFESLSLSYTCHKQTDDGRVVYITCIPTTCCG